MFSTRTTEILPMYVSEGRYSGRLLLTKAGHALDFYGGDGKVRRMVAIPYQPKVRKPYERKNGRVITIKPKMA